MTTRKYLTILILAAIIGWSAFWLVVNYFEPCTAPGILTLCYSLALRSHVLFFLSLCVALVSTFSLLGFTLRLWLNHSEVYLDHVTVSLRQGLLLALCTLAALFFLTLKALTWWTGLLLIGVILLIELYATRE